MKTLFKSLFVAAAVAFSATSCTQEGKENAEAAGEHTEAATERVGDAASAEATNAANETEAAAAKTGDAIENTADKAEAKTEAAAAEVKAESEEAAAATKND